MKRLRGLSEITVTTCPSRCAPVRRPEFVIPPHRTLAEIEKMAILQTLQRTNWNKQEAAQILGLYRPPVQQDEEARDPGRRKSARRALCRAEATRLALAASAGSVRTAGRWSFPRCRWRWPLFACGRSASCSCPLTSSAKRIRQIYELGLRSAPLIAVSGMAVGVVLSMHTRASLERFGAESMIPAGLAIALVRETGPADRRAAAVGPDRRRHRRRARRDARHRADRRARGVRRRLVSLPGRDSRRSRASSPCRSSRR